MLIVALTLYLRRGLVAHAALSTTGGRAPRPTAHLMVGAAQLGGRLLRLYLPLGFFLVAMLFPFYGWDHVDQAEPRALQPAHHAAHRHQPTLKHTSTC